MYATGWTAGLARGCKVGVQSLAVEPTKVRAVAVSIPALSVKIHSYRFPELPEWVDERSPGPRAGSNGKPMPVPAERSRTLIRPPNDIIKLADRLYYVLQPPLETMLAAGSLRMPFEPFPYQFQGIGFLYPRVAAILADEMGLGKTMQAITAVRLLLRSGRGPQRAVDLPQTAGVQLAARVHDVGAGRYRCASWRGTRCAGVGSGSRPPRR